MVKRKSVSLLFCHTVYVIIYYICKRYVSHTIPHKNYTAVWTTKKSWLASC